MLHEEGVFFVREARSVGALVLDLEAPRSVFVPEARHHFKEWEELSTVVEEVCLVKDRLDEGSKGAGSSRNGEIGWVQIDPVV